MIANHDFVFIASTAQVISEGMVEDYWERLKSRHIRNYNKSNSTNNTNTNNTNISTNSTKSPRRPLHPKISPLRMPPRGWKNQGGQKTEL